MKTFFFLEITIILVQKIANRRLILGEDLFFFFLEITIILMQKVECFFCMGRQYFLCVKMALGSKRLDTPVLDFICFVGII